MIPHQYYYLVAALPDLQLDGGKLPMTREVFLTEVVHHLLPSDKELFRFFLYPADNRNILDVLNHVNRLQAASSSVGNPFMALAKLSRDELQMEFEAPSVWSPDELLSLLVEPEGFPEYLQRFIQTLSGERLDDEATGIIGFEELSPENQITALFYADVVQSDNEFIRGWFRFELDLRNILAALMARRHGLSVTNELIELADDPIVGHLRKSTAVDFGLSQDWPEIEVITHTIETADFVSRELALDGIRWNRCDDLVTYNYFTVERLMSTWIKLGLAERWMHCDDEAGATRLGAMVNSLRAEFEFPEEFTVIGGRKHGD